MAKEMTADLARATAQAFNVDTFQRKASYSAKADAQANLTGRTHYVDSDTLKYFHARINSCRAVDNGALLLIVESVAADYENRSRGFRFVAFDLTGTVLERADSDNLHKTSAQAEKAMWAWADSFDCLAHYRVLLQERAERAKRNAADMLATAKRLK